MVDVVKKDFRLIEYLGGYYDVFEYFIAEITYGLDGRPIIMEQQYKINGLSKEALLLLCSAKDKPILRYNESTGVFEVLK